MPNFLNLLDKSITDKVKDSYNIHRYFYQLTDIMPEFFDEITLDHPLPRIQTVVHIAIYVSIALGYKEIRLLGVDHDWLLHFGQSRHFYKESDSKLTEKGYEEFNLENDLEHQFKSHLVLWKIYKSIKKISHHKKISILNLNVNSFLDIFPKKKLEQF